MNAFPKPNVRTTPFVNETRALANQCFERFYRMTGRCLDSETPRADLEAFMLIATGFSAALRDAQRDGNEMLALHIGELLNDAKREGAYAWLNGLAIDGNDDCPGSHRPVSKMLAALITARDLIDGELADRLAEQYVTGGCQETRDSIAQFEAALKQINAAITEGSALT